MTSEIIELDVIQIELTVKVFAVADSTAIELERELTKVESLQHQIIRINNSAPLRDQLKDKVGDLPNVVIIELNEQHEDALDDVKGFIEQHGQRTEVYITFPSENMRLMPALMRSGVRDVLPLPINSQDLIVALTNTLNRNRNSVGEPQDKKGSVMSFMSTRGGAGGPFVATNIAYLLKTKFSKRTVLIDLDLQFGTTAYDLDIKSDGGVLEALRNPNRIDSVFLDALVARHTSGLDVLPSPADMSSWDGISPQALSKLIKVLAAKYDHVIFNLPMLMNNVVEQVLALSNPVYLVTQDTISMLRNLNMMLQRFPKRGIPTGNIEIIQNREGAGVKAVKNYELEKLISDVPLHKVRNDYKLAARAENEGKTVGELSPRTGMVKDLVNIAEQIVMFDSESAESAEPAARPTKRWFS